MSGYTAADYRRRCAQFAARRNHPDPGKAARAHRHLDWWLERYAAYLNQGTAARG